MKVSVEKLPTSEAVLEVDVTWDEMEKASDKAYRKLVQKIDVPGFRRGKAPRSLVERKLGKEHIYHEGLDDLITETYRTAIKEHELRPITQPKLESPELEIGQPYHFSLTIPILTPVEPGDYHSLHFDREEIDVTSEEVEKELESLYSRQVTWATVERPAAIGDRVTVDLKLTVEEQSISDLKDNPFELTDERHGLFSGMDEHIVGMQVGESKMFTTAIPADYTNEKVAGKEANYAVTLYKVEVKEVPELDDALAEKVSNGQFQTLEDLRKAISDNIFEGKKRRARDELREKVLDAVVEQAHVVVHALLVQDEAEALAHQVSHLLEQQYMSMDQYLKMLGKTRAEYLQELQPDAEKRVKRNFVLDAIAEREGIEVAPEEIETLFRTYAQSGQRLPRTEEQTQALERSLLREKTVTRLLELTTDPDPDAEIVSDEEEAVEASANGEAVTAEGESEPVTTVQPTATVASEAVQEEPVQMPEDITAQ